MLILQVNRIELHSIFLQSYYINLIKKKKKKSLYFELISKNEMDKMI